MADSIIKLRSSLSRLLGKSFSGKRDLYEVLGYKRLLRGEDFAAMYYRNDIASRIIRAFPQATWRETPKVRDEAGASSEESLFVREWEGLCERFGVVRYMERADRVASIGQFGLLYMGFADDRPAHEPLDGQPELAYLTPFGEINVTVAEWNADTQSPRFGMPERYTLQTGNPLIGKQSRSKSLTVHHSRCIHIAEHVDEDEVYGIPRLMAVYNRLQDLEKIAGGSAETFWLLANKGLALLARSDADLTPEARDAAKEQAEEYQHQLRRTLALQGMDVQHLGSETPDPSSNIASQLDLIAGAVGIPKRILIGSERGELASSSDDDNWAARIDERRTQFAGPCIVKPFVDAMIATGNLREPQGDWWVEFDPLAGLSEGERADINQKKVQTFKTWCEAALLGGDQYLPATEMREQLLGWEPVPEGEDFDDVDPFGDAGEDVDDDV